VIRGEDTFRGALMGFCVASTMNGRGSLSCGCQRYFALMAFEQRGVRFRRRCGDFVRQSMLAKIGPGLKSNRCSIWLNIAGANYVEGSRSEVN